MPSLTKEQALLRQITDRSAILEVATRYAAALDAKDWAELGSLFTEDATWEYAGDGAPLPAPDAVARISLVLQPLQATQHLLGNHMVKVDGDEAEHTCYVQAQHVGQGGQKYLGAGRYTDRLRRTNEGWRFTRRTLVSVWSDGDPSVLAGSSEAPSTGDRGGVEDGPV
ncbi:nuclear transport factor 2 family protein [Actinomadura harenae]|uniref:Nuclear transport factor 2 family protein n=1 Tax=Actinomadura harenae TaxID=2483351 RepID=A0A3M2MCB5_9ACTN|nr:nuclear transport factor 2 family protein [Actinomadura harenae]RMI47169.1 nuclear transport factor 2 family protein [Actinomadura harenae]